MSIKRGGTNISTLCTLARPRIGIARMGVGINQSINQLTKLSKSCV